jgi:hypothetical protein
MKFGYGVGSNFLTGAPSEFEDLLILQLCMNPQCINPNWLITKQGYIQANLHNQIAIRKQMTKLCPCLEAHNFHHKLHILNEAIIRCSISSYAHHSYNFLQYECRAYHCIAPFNGVIEPHQDGHIHWHIMLYSNVLSSELLETTAVLSTVP